MVILARRKPRRTVRSSAGDGVKRRGYELANTGRPGRRARPYPAGASARHSTRLTKYVAPDSAVIQKLTGQSV